MSFAATNLCLKKLNSSDLLIIFLTLFVFFTAITDTNAATVTLAWDQAASPDISGYKVYYGESSMNYQNSIDVGSSTSCSISGLQEGKTYYFAATSYNTNNLESDYSAAVAHRIPTQNADSDGDGISDTDELNLYGTNPNRADTDGDGVKDGEELSYWGNKWNADHDSDGINNLIDYDSDNDGLSDGYEIFSNYDPSGPGVSVYSPQILDNGDTGTSSTGFWQESYRAGSYEGYSLYSRTSGATYTFEAPVNGNVDVMLWWNHYSTRCAQVPVNIYDDEELIETVHVNQKNNGGQWNLIDRYLFNGVGRIEIVSQSGCTSSADAVQFMPADNSGDPVISQPDANAPTNTTSEKINPVDDASYPTSKQPSHQILDNGDAGTSSTGLWNASYSAGAYGSHSLYSRTSGATYTFEAPVNGNVDVMLWWNHYSTRCAQVPVNIYDGEALIQTVYVNQKNNGGQWNLIDRYLFNGVGRIEIVSQSGCTSSADAVQFMPADNSGDPVISQPDANAPTNTTSEKINPVDDASYPTSKQPSHQILDNGDAGTSSTGLWNVSNRGAEAYGNLSVYSRTAGATYSFEAPAIGNVDVMLWWTNYSTRCVQVPVNIYDNEELLETVHVNQTGNGGQWNLIDRYLFSGVARIEILSQAGCTSSVDAAQFESVP